MPQPDHEHAPSFQKGSCSGTLSRRSSVGVPVKMTLSKGDVELILTVVQAFVDALPSTSRTTQPSQSQTEERNRLERNNEITLLKVAIYGLSELAGEELKEILGNHRDTCDSSNDASGTANDALKDLLQLLNELVDERILTKEGMILVSVFVS